ALTGRCREGAISLLGWPHPSIAGVTSSPVTRAQRSTIALPGSWSPGRGALDIERQLAPSDCARRDSRSGRGHGARWPRRVGSAVARKPAEKWPVWGERVGPRGG